MFQLRTLAIAAITTAGLGLGTAQADDSLFQELGGLEVITQFSNETIDISMADPRIKHTFEDENVNPRRVKRMLVEQICALTGGPCVYEGRTMKESHEEDQITNAQFNAIVEDLQIAMDNAGVPFRTQNKLLALLAPMQRDIVTK